MTSLSAGLWRVDVGRPDVLGSFSVSLTGMQRELQPNHEKTSHKDVADISPVWIRRFLPFRRISVLSFLSLGNGRVGGLCTKTAVCRRLLAHKCLAWLKASDAHGPL